MSTNKTNSSTHVNILPLNEVMQVMHNDVLNFKNILRDDNSDETVRHIIEEIGDYPVDERLPDTISTCIRNMITCIDNYTAQSLSGDLTILAQELEEAITSCQHKDNVQFVRTILKVMLKHADEVTLWLEEELQ